MRALTHALEQRRLHHAYLFTGTRGVGKTTLARILAKSLNCEMGMSASPCGQCAACLEIDRGRFIDVVELDAASNTGIDNMREVLDNAQYAATSGRYKVYIIDEVHMLSKAAFNSMLKTLEEPPEHVNFILATTDPQKIPVTVLSRCLQFNLKQMPPALISGHLQRVLEQENIACDTPSLHLIARAASGSMRDALSLLDQAIAYGGGTVEEAGVRGMLGTLDQTYLFSLLSALGEHDGAAMLAIAEQMAERSLSFDAALQDLGVLLHQIALAQIAPDALAEDLPERPQIIALAQSIDAETVQLYYQISLLGRKDLPLAPDEFSGFSMTLLRMLAFTPALHGERAAQPAAREEPAPPVRVATVAETQKIPQVADVKKNRFEGDWHQLVNSLKLGGMAKMLAQHCEIKRFEGERMELCVPEEHKHLLEKVYQERLKAALSEHLGLALSLTFSTGSVTGITPAVQQSKEKQEKQALAIAAIEQDPFVRELVENFDAKVIEASIKPI